jgi:O-antigen/teichoic acid export membrane protein
MALTGRALGVVLFGAFVLINSYAEAICGLSKFQSWQLVVHYGGKTLSGGDAQQFKQSVGFAIGLDLAGGLVGMVLGVILVPVLAPKFGIPTRYVTATMLYCTVVPIMVSATAAGILRCLDRFDLIGWQGTAQPVARAILVGAAWFGHASIEVFLVIWFVTTVLAEFLLWYLAWRELRRRGLLDGIRPALRSRSLVGAWRFAINININSALLAASGPMGRLLVGGLLGPAGAALYRAASSLTNAIQKPAELLAKTFYPEIARLDPRSKAPWILMIRSAALASAIALPALAVLVLAGRPLVELIFGQDFAGAYEPLLVLAVVPLIGTISFPLPWMLYALDLPHAPAIARLVGTVVYLASVAPLAWSFGLIGAAAAFVAGEAVRIIVMMLIMSREYRRMSGSQRTAEPEVANVPAE